MEHLFFLDVTQLWMVVNDVSGQPINL